MTKDIIKKIKSIQENNVLFEHEQEESELSEVKDPLILDRCKSDRFLKTTMDQFKIDSECFNKGKAKRSKNKVKPNDKFHNVRINDPGAQWRSDRKWRIQCNPEYKRHTEVEDRKELRMVQKRHHAHMLKNMALEQDTKVLDKMLQKELRKNLF